MRSVGFPQAHRVLLLVGLAIITPNESFADPITVTGSILFGRTAGQLSLEGENFLFTGSVFSGVFDPPNRCTPCDPGADVSLGGFWSGLSVGASTLMIDGVSHTLSPGSRIAANVVLTLAGTIRAPDLIGTTATASAPFQLSGTIFYHPNPNPTLPRAELDLVGTGTATLTFGRNEGSPYWTYQSGVYVLGEPPPAIPEPSTLALLGLGLVSGAVRAARRRRSIT